MLDLSYKTISRNINNDLNYRLITNNDKPLDPSEKYQFLELIFYGKGSFLKEKIHVLKKSEFSNYALKTFKV